MDFKEINEKVIELIENRAELAKLDYSDKKYDKIEDKLHDLEDLFLEEYGPELEEIIDEIHADIKSDDDCLEPIAYIPQECEIKGSGKKKEYSAKPAQGVVITTEKYPDVIARLALLPNPLRLELIVGNAKKEVVWEAK